MNTSNEQRLSSNDDLFFKDCFTEVDEGKVDAEFNNISMNCFNSKNNKFSMDSDGNLVVNSITSKESISAGYNIDLIYPIGSIYMSMNSANPGTLFGGTWEQIESRFLFAAGKPKKNNYDNFGKILDVETENYNFTAGATLGEFHHTLTVEEMPSHNHSYNSQGSTPISGYVGAVTQYGTNYMETNNVGGNIAHNNMPPALVVYMWKRIA